MTARRSDIVCISTQAWGYLWTRKQRFMDRFAQLGYRVLYVEPIEPFLWQWKGQGHNQSLGMTAQVNQVKPNLHVLSLPVMLPFSRRYRLLNWLNQRRAIPIIGRCMDRLDMRSPIVWTYTPLVGKRISALGGRRLVYDCVDAFGQYPGMGRFAQGMEDDLLRRADVALVTSESLLARASRLASRVHLVPNGVDAGLLRRATLPETEIPADLANLPRPIVGFVGALAEWVDLEAIRVLAERRPSWSIVLIGPWERRSGLAMLARYSNLSLLGYRPKESLPGYLKGFDVCICPFRPGELASAADPLKVYEYLAAGKPVVVSGLPAMRRLAGLLYIAEEPGTYVEQVEKALGEHDEERVRQRLAFAEGRSWDRLFARVLAVAEELSEGRTCR
ncbi:MAG: glycosyltransferase [Anaerolineae bacterium]|nr:glycosyltransferase [Anaerolineae bacterium]